MTQEDAKIIFSNIAELALFSDLFCEELETALGSVVEGGSGPDRVGELFLKLVGLTLFLSITFSTSSSFVRYLN